MWFGMKFAKNSKTPNISIDGIAPSNTPFVRNNVVIRPSIIKAIKNKTILSIILDLLQFGHKPFEILLLEQPQ